MDKLQEAIEKWAKRYYDLYTEHGAPEGQEPDEWCNDVMLDDVLENKEFIAALQKELEASFLAAAKKQGF